jgi:hypothetical protein
MNSTTIKNKLFEKFSAFAISQTVFLHTGRTTDIDELTDQELAEVYKIFFPTERNIAEQVFMLNYEKLLKEHRSIVLSIATRIGLKEPDSWDKFNNWMLKSSILKKKLNDYNLQEIKDLERQLRATESNYQASAEKAGNKAWYHKNKFPIPSKN